MNTKRANKLCILSQEQPRDSAASCIRRTVNEGTRNSKVSSRHCREVPDKAIKFKIEGVEVTVHELFATKTNMDTRWQSACTAQCLGEALRTLRYVGKVPAERSSRLHGRATSPGQDGTCT